ncbi:GAF domain-containing protein [Nostoc sp. FACHB-133]|uniref:GAF domain-containing protein n=1 Tax=Nostoc sp. FACHB-133 TaxID=2692835 RepID=UPI0016844CC6|nr:GAF domain-containing protein [Nostoc sp. FACHB-133]MBD2525805.1 GAF domain-containing protein [Nostoc sp. FACHB-133]
MVIHREKTELEIIEQVGAIRAIGNQVDVAITKIVDAVGNVQRHNENILNAGIEIENITSKIANQEEILHQISQEIQSSQNFDVVAIQLVSSWERTIETVIGSEWAGIAKHYLEEDPDLRDIQADIFFSHKTEIIAGWDSRFDEWVYERYNHQNLVRIFTPIFICRDIEGKIQKNLFENYNWHYSRKWHETDFNEDWFKGNDNSDKSKGQHTIIEPPSLPKDLELEVIGTVEVVYKDRNHGQAIEPQQAIQLTKFVCSKALEILQTRFSYLLETIAQSAISLVNADSASLHFLKIPNDRKVQQSDSEYINFLYGVFAGRTGRHIIQSCLPRKNGIGQQAINEKRVQLIPDPVQRHNLQELKYFNSELYAEGIKSIAALPLFADHQQGVLYIHFRDEHQFTIDEKRLLESFNITAINAIKHAVSYLKLRQNTHQLIALHSLTAYLSYVTDRKELLQHLAAIIQNILGADIVTIYEYDEQNKKLLSLPSSAGKLKNEKLSSKDINEDEVPYRLINKGKSVYIPYLDVYDPQSSEEEIFKDSNFSIREDIKSVVGLLLKQSKLENEFRVRADIPENLLVNSVKSAWQIITTQLKEPKPSLIEVNKTQKKDLDEGVVCGVIFINYRRHYEFSSQETHFLHILATWAAITMKRLKVN